MAICPLISNNTSTVFYIDIRSFKKAPRFHRLIYVAPSGAPSFPNSLMDSGHKNVLSDILAALTTDVSKVRGNG